MALFNKTIDNTYSVVFTKNGSKVTCNRTYDEVLKAVNDGKNIKFSFNVRGNELKYTESNVTYSYKLDKENKKFNILFFSCEPVIVRDRGLEFTVVTLNSKNVVAFSIDKIELQK